MGNIPPKARPPQPIPVHPHVCGEHKPVRVLMSRPGGSSPRVWGTCRHCEHNQITKRFIPTCVGNMRSGVVTVCRKTVHPHVCGEHCSLVFSSSARAGSSPRVWGTLLPSWYSPFVSRFIPTCVGNIPIVPVRFPAPSVHPHVCGEHGLTTFSACCLTGSSPRVWGT